MTNNTKSRIKILSFALLSVVLCVVITLSASATSSTTASSVLSDVATVSPTVSEDGTSLILPSVPEGYTISIHGTSNESVIDTKGNIYEPLVDTFVKVSYKVTNLSDGSFAVENYKDASVMIKGQYEQGVNDNAEPAVLPKLREWKGGTGTVSISAASRIVVTHKTFFAQAELINEYIEGIIGMPLEITTGTAKSGDIVIGYTDQKELGNEGYTVELSDVVTILAYNSTGALYGGTTVAQMLTLYEGYALPKGYIRDYPAYAVRASLIDVARHYVPLDYLSEMSKYLAYFKVNQIHVHINDNGGQQYYAFRVESKKYPEINSSLGDNIYSQEDYRAYQTELLRYGVKVITEIDSPGHAGFAGLYDASLVKSDAKGYLDLTNNYDGCVSFMEGLVDEFVNGYNGNPPVIIDEVDTIHLGMDEYSYDHDQYKKYMGEICAYTKSLGKKVQVWSSLKTADFDEELPVSADDVIVNYWGDADLKAYANEGFSAISNYPGKLYIVPGGTNSFYDNIDIVSVYDSYEANVVSSSLTLAESSPLLLGVEGALWNDRNSGVSKEGLFNRICDQMLLVSEKTWHGKAEGVTGAQFAERLAAIKNLVPVVNPQSFVSSNENGVIAEYDFDKAENGKVKDKANGLDATLNGITVNKVGNDSVLTLDGSGYLSLPVEQIGFPYTVSFGLTYSSTTSGILFAGGDTTFWLNKNADGKISYTRELHSYAFNFIFENNVYYDITLLCNEKTLGLFVDGVYVGDARIVSMATEHQALTYLKFSEAVLSTARIGEGIVGTIDNLKILGNADKDALLGNDNTDYRNVAFGKKTTASGTEVNFKWFPENAVDGITQGSDFKVSLNRVDNAWLTIDLEGVYYINQIKIYFLQSPAKYKVLVSVDGVNYTEIYDQPNANAGKKSDDVIILEDAIPVRYVKYQQVEMFSTTISNGTVAKYSGNFTEIEVYGSKSEIEVDNDYKTKYGKIPLVDALANDFALFVKNDDGSYSLNSMYTTYPNAMTAALGLTKVSLASPKKEVVILLLRDYEGTSFPNNLSSIATNVTVDLNGYTLGAFESLGNTTTGGAETNATINFINGKILLKKHPGLYIAAGGTYTVDYSKTLNINFENIYIGFAPGASAPALLGRIASTTAAIAEFNLKYTNCTIDMVTNRSTNATLMLGKWSPDSGTDRSKVTVDFINCNFIGLTESDFVARTTAGQDVVRYSKTDNNQYATLTLPKNALAPRGTYSIVNENAKFVKISETETEIVYALRPTAVANINFTPKTSITLGSELVYNVYIPVVDYLKSFTVDGNAYVDANIVTLDDGNQYYHIAVPMPASEAARNVVLKSTVTIDGKDYNGTFTMSVPKYSKKVLASDANQTEKTLVKDVLAYIKAAYIYFNADDKTEIVNAIDEILGDYNNVFAKVEGSTDADNGLWGVVIVLEEKPTIRFVLPEGVTADGYTFKSGNTTLEYTVGTMTIGENTHYYAEVSLFAYQMINEITYTDGTNSGTWHINSYYDFVTTDDELKSDANLISLVEKLYNYCKSAEAYRASVTNK